MKRCLQARSRIYIVKINQKILLNYRWILHSRLFMTREMIRSQRERSRFVNVSVLKSKNKTVTAERMYNTPIKKNLKKKYAYCLIYEHAPHCLHSYNKVYM